MSSLWTNLLLIGIALGGGLAFFYGAARHLQFSLAVHDLRVNANALRVEQLKRLAILRGSDAWDSADLVMDPRTEHALMDIQSGNANIADENGDFKQAA